MGTATAERRENWTMRKFREMTGSLQAKNPEAASWLEEAQRGLAEIFGANPGDIWENLAFLTYLGTLLNAVEQMQLNRVLRVISRDVSQQVSREWNGATTDVHALVKRELIIVRNVEKLQELYDEFGTFLRGMPEENGGAEAYCRGALIRLFRMHRLSRITP